MAAGVAQRAYALVPHRRVVVLANAAVDAWRPHAFVLVDAGALVEFVALRTSRYGETFR